MSEKKPIIKLLALCMLLLTAFAMAVPSFAADDEYDLSNKDRDASEAIGAVSLIEEHLGYRLRDAERAFLDSYSTLTVRYNSVINASNVKSSYEDGTLTVIAAEYTYEAEKGKTLVWIPESVMLDGISVPLAKTDAGYVASLTADCGRDVSVLYRAKAEIAADDLGEVLNLYYYTAKYAADIADYGEKLAAYERYIYEKRLYDDKKAEYHAYLAAYRDYEDQLYVFENFDKLMAQYSLDLAEYNAYLVKLESLADDIARYEAYEAKLAAIEKQLSSFELVYVKMKSNRSIYSAVMGGAVDQVLGSVGDIIAELGSKYKTLVNTAERATKNLRGLMTGYQACKTVEEKYGFYTANYDSMCDNMLDLTWALDLLYYAPGVKTMLKAFGKHEFYVILVAQLALTSNALIDSEVSAGEGDAHVKYDSSWVMDGRSYTAVLDNVHYFTDDDTSAPFEDGYPAKVEKPDIKVVEEPKIPKRPSSRPVAPTSVADPGAAPEAVADPKQPNAASAAIASIYSKLSTQEKADLVSEIFNGVLSERDLPNTAKTVELKTIVDKKYNSRSVILTFDVPAVATGMQSFVYTIETDCESPVLYDGPVPDGYSNIEGTYEFAGWSVRGSSEKADMLKGFEDSTVLVPFYDRSPTYFNVTWRVGDKEYVEKHVSGSIPAPSFVPTKADEGDYCYLFNSWKREGTNTGITALYSDVTYEAKFVKKHLLPGGSGGAAITDNGSALVCDVSDFTSPMFDLSRILPRIAGRRGLVLMSSGGTMKSFTLSFSFTDVVRMHDTGVLSLVLIANLDGEGAFAELSMYKQGNEKLTASDVRPELTIGHSFADVSRFALIGGNDYANFKIDSSTLSFRLALSQKYTLRREYYVTVVKNELCDIEVDKTCAVKGDRVSVRVQPDPGIMLVGIDVTDDEGNPIAPDENGKILITDSDVVISARVKHILYNVTFVSGGAVISRRQLTFGTMPTLPPDPTAPSDGEYSYTFIGWSPEVRAVSADITYTASFRAVPLGDMNVQSQGGPMNNIMKYVKIALVAFGAVVLAVITLTVVSVLRKKRKRAVALNPKEPPSDGAQASDSGGAALREKRKLSKPKAGLAGLAKKLKNRKKKPKDDQQSE